MRHRTDSRRKHEHREQEPLTNSAFPLSSTLRALLLRIHHRIDWLSNNSSYSDTLPLLFQQGNP
jgi:hypothetical protein